jgi:hypothetical protein
METQTKKVLVMIAISIASIMLILSTSLALPSEAATFAFSKSNFHHPLKIDNKYFPLKPGTTFIYKGTKEGDPTRDTFEVTSKVKVIAGITTREIHDKLFTKGVLTESTQDWFAQDDNGNVWYFGEFTTDFSSGGSHEGSWQAGVKGAKAGIIMEAQPKVGDTYNQEVAKGVAEDKATVLSLNDKVCVTYGCFTHVLKTKEFTPLEPGIAENKFYAQNIGNIKALSVKGESEEQHLVQIKGGDSSTQQQGNSIQNSNLGSAIHDLKQQDHSKTSDGNNQPSQQQQIAPQRQQDQSKITNGENQSSSQ